MQPEQYDAGVETLMHTSGMIFNVALVEAFVAARKNPERG